MESQQLRSRILFLFWWKLIIKKRERLNNQKWNVPTNIPGVEHRLPQDFRQLLRHWKVAHSEGNLSPLENSCNSEVAMMYLRDVAKKKCGKTPSRIKVFTSFPGEDCICDGTVRTFRPWRLFLSDSLALLAKVRGTDGDIFLQRFTVLNEVWLSLITVWKEIKFYKASFPRPT